ncbi:MAG: PD40 domain-containing protein [Saprospiraceae bacterium]|nr:PD40 domain-containing protein [Saprospiraceae bacterium]
MINIKNILPLLLLLTCLAAPASAQSLQRARTAMDELDFMTAIQEYQLLLQREDNPEAKINLAECYRKINDTDNAEYWYAQVVVLPQAKSIHYLYYGMMLQANGKCPEAKPWYKKFVDERPDDARAANLLRACELEGELMRKNAGIYTIAQLPVNSSADDYGPAIWGNQLVFASDRDQGTYLRRTSMWTGNPFSELYAIRFDSSGSQGDPGQFVYQSAEKFSSGLNGKFNEAAATFSADGETVYFTRNNYLEGRIGKSEDGLMKLKIFSGHAAPNGGWTNLQALPFCSDEFTCAHPSLSKDGKRLFFTSNMPGGYGGMDLYVSAFEGGRWGPPLNLGPVVNTEGNEIFPFIDPNNRLYFASNGHIGLGGLDIFYTTEKNDAAWNLPANLGYPVNSTRDDFGICFGPDLSWGFFSSDRDGGTGRDDLYGFKKSAVAVEIQVADALTGQALPGALLTDSRSGHTYTAGADGRLAFDLKTGECVEFSAAKTGYDAGKGEICTHQATPGSTLVLQISLEKQAKYTISGIVFDMLDGLPAQGAQVYLSNVCGRPSPPPFITGADGRYRFRVDKDCCYTVKATQNGYIAGVSTELCTQGLVAGSNIKTNLNLLPYGPDVLAGTPDPSVRPVYDPLSGLYENPDGTPADAELAEGLTLREGILYDNGVPTLPSAADWQSAPTGEGFLLNVYYDFDQANMREESMPELQKLLRMLSDNPEFKVEVAAHTDTQGSDEYNLLLSQRRAEAVVTWLMRQGIQRDRLLARGYGETRPVRPCSDAVPCSEVDHQMNRRTEFHILEVQPVREITAPKAKKEGKDAPF